MMTFVDRLRRIPVLTYFMKIFSWILTIRIFMRK